MNENQVNQQPNAATNKNNKSIIIIVAVIALLAIISMVYYFVFMPAKTLNCTKSDTESGMKMDQDIKFTFKGNKVQDANMKIDIDLGEMASYKDQFVKSLEEQYKTLESQGLKTKITSKDDKVIVDASVSKDKISSLGQFSLNSEDYKKVKEEMEKEGYSCK